MKKQVISLLLITSTLTHGMEEQENNPYSHTSFIPYNFIRKSALSRQLCDADVAIEYNFPAVSNEIKRFAYIAGDYNDKFNDNDLKKSWFLNATVLNPHLPKPLPQSLVQVALETGNTRKVLQIIKHAQELNFCYHNNQNPLLFIARERSKMRRGGNHIYNNTIYDDLLKIAQKLLKKGLDVNYRRDKDDYTPIMSATKRKDTEFTTLLLQHKANLCITRYNQYLERTENPFSLQSKDNWLLDIMNTIAT